MFFSVQCFDCKRFDSERAREKGTKHRCTVYPYGIPRQYRCNQTPCPDFAKRKLEL